MTFKAEHDLKFTLQFVLLAACAGVTLGAYLLADNLLALIVSLPLLLATGVCGMQLYKTEYTLGDSLLTAQSGLSKVSVDYRDITLVTDSKDAPAYGYLPLATSSNKLYVIYTQDGKAYRMEISPRDREGFAKSLGEKL